MEVLDGGNLVLTHVHTAPSNLLLRLRYVVSLSSFSRKVKIKESSCNSIWFEKHPQVPRYLSCYTGAYVSGLRQQKYSSGASVGRTNS